MARRCPLLAIAFVLIAAAAVNLAPAANAAPAKEAVKQAYDKYIASYNRYLDALQKNFEERELKGLAEKYLEDMKNYKKLIGGDDDMAANADSRETELERLYKLEQTKNAPAAGSGALTGEAKKQFAIVKVNEVKKALEAFAAGYDKKCAASSKKYKETSWFNPISKIGAAYTMIKDKFARNKVEATMKYYRSPRANMGNLSFFREILVEFGHVTSISKVLYDTNIDKQSFLSKDAEKHPDVLTVFTMPSPHGINWASPKGLALAGGINQLTTFHTSAKHPIGHVFMSLKTAEYPEGVTAGMTTFDNTEEVELVMKHGYCLGVLFADLRGKFDDADALEAQVAERNETGRVSYMKFMLSPSMGRRVSQFFREYSEKKCFEHYGGANRARYGEGGGCSPFGVGFMDVAGFLNDEHEKAWKITLAVPKRVCGGPAFGKRVSFKSLIGAGAWAKDGEDSAPIVMWDPTLMYRWMLNEWKREFGAPAGKYILEKNEKTMGLVVDCRDIEASNDPIWLSGPNPYRQHGLRFGPDPYKFNTDGTVK